jgi:hypothetical protein
LGHLRPRKLKTQDEIHSADEKIRYGDRPAVNERFKWEALDGTSPDAVNDVALGGTEATTAGAGLPLSERAVCDINKPATAAHEAAAANAVDNLRGGCRNGFKLLLER